MPTFLMEILGIGIENSKICLRYLVACYYHLNEIITAKVILMGRFVVREKNLSILSRIIRDIVDSGLIKLEDENITPKLRQYVTYWV